MSLEMVLRSVGARLERELGDELGVEFDELGELGR